MEPPSSKCIKPLSYKFNFFLLNFLILFFVAIINFKVFKDDIITKDVIILVFDTCFKVISSLVFILAFNDKKILNISFINIIEKENELVNSYKLVIIFSIILNFSLLFAYAFYTQYTLHSNIITFLFVYGLTISVVSSMVILIYIFHIFHKYMLYKKLENPRDDIDFSKYRKTTLLYIFKNLYIHNNDENGQLSDIKHLFNSIINKTNLLSDNDVIDIIESRADTFSEQVGLTNYVPTSKKIDSFTMFLMEQRLRKDHQLKPINFSEGYLFYKVIEDIDERLLNKLMSTSPLFSIRMNLNDNSFYLSIYTYYKEIAKRLIPYTNSLNDSRYNNIITNDIFLTFNINVDSKNNFTTDKSIVNICASLSSLYFSIIEFIINNENTDFIKDLTLKYFKHAHYDPNMLTDIRFSILSKCIAYAIEINKDNESKLKDFKIEFEKLMDKYIKIKFDNYKISEDDINNIFYIYDNIISASNMVDDTSFNSKDYVYISSFYNNHFISAYSQKMFDFFNLEIDSQRYHDNILTHLKNKIMSQQDLRHYYDESKIKSTVDKIDLYLKKFKREIEINDNQNLISLKDEILGKFSITKDMIYNKDIKKIHEAINKTYSDNMSNKNKFIKIGEVLYYLEDILTILYDNLSSQGVKLSNDVPYINEYVAEALFTNTNSIYQDDIDKFICNDNFQKYFFSRLNDRLENNISTKLDNRITNYKEYNASNLDHLKVLNKYKDMGFYSYQPIIRDLIHQGYMDFYLDKDELEYVLKLVIDNHPINYNYQDIYIMPNIFSISIYFIKIFEVYKDNINILKFSLILLSQYFKDISEYTNFQEYITLEAIKEINNIIENLKNEEIKPQYQDIKNDINRCIDSIKHFLAHNNINLNYTLDVLNSKDNKGNKKDD